MSSILSAMEGLAAQATDPKRGSRWHFLLPAAAALCLFPFVSTGLGLLFGLVLALAFGNPFLDKTRKATQVLLPLSIVGLGAGLDLRVAAPVAAPAPPSTLLAIASPLPPPSL